MDDEDEDNAPIPSARLRVEAKQTRKYMCASMLNVIRVYASCGDLVFLMKTIGRRNTVVRVFEEFV